MRKEITYVVIAIAVLVLYFVVVASDVLGTIIPFFTFATTLILPWIALYWFIRLVKSIEKRR